MTVVVNVNKIPKSYETDGKEFTTFVKRDVTRITKDILTIEKYNKNVQCDIRIVRLFLLIDKP